jgi:predicted DNA-binding transcriptional regulator AlpA
MIPASEFIDQISEIISRKVTEAVNSNSKKADDEKLISSKEACELFQPAISRPTLHSWAKQGKIQPRYTGGKRVFYLKSEVMEAAKVIKRYGK